MFIFQIVAAVHFISMTAGKTGAINILFPSIKTPSAEGS